MSNDDFGTTMKRPTLSDALKRVDADEKANRPINPPRYIPPVNLPASKEKEEHLEGLEAVAKAVAGRMNERLGVPKDLLGRNRVIGLKNADGSIGVNPKDRIGASKVDFSLIPTSAKVALALALMDGANKYGQYNWRVEAIQTRTYLSAAERHLEDYKESEETARDSLIKHLGHTMACCAILIDAAVHGKLIDDRPIVLGKSGADLIEEVNQWIKENKPEGWGR